MKSGILLVLILLSNKIYAQHALGAHEHGTIKVAMAIENKIVEIDIDGPSESFLGFEYLPKTTAEKKLFKDLELKWTKNLNSLVGFNKNLNCKTTEASFVQVKEGEGSHSDIEAKAKITCEKDPKGSEVSISLMKTFKNIKKLSVEVISSETKTVEITKLVQSFKI